MNPWDRYDDIRVPVPSPDARDGAQSRGRRLRRRRQVVRAGVAALTLTVLAPIGLSLAEASDGHAPRAAQVTSSSSSTVAPTSTTTSTTAPVTTSSSAPASTWRPGGETPDLASTTTPPATTPAATTTAPPIDSGDPSEVVVSLSVFTNPVPPGGEVWAELFATNPTAHPITVTVDPGCLTVSGWWEPGTYSPQTLPVGRVHVESCARLPITQTIPPNDRWSSVLRLRGEDTAIPPGTYDVAAGYRTSAGTVWPKTPVRVEIL